MISLEKDHFFNTLTAARQRQQTAAGQPKSSSDTSPPGTEATVPGTASNRTQIGRNSVRHRNPDAERPAEEIDEEIRRRRRQMLTLTTQNLSKSQVTSNVCHHQLSQRKYAVLARGCLLYPEFLLRS